MISWRILLAAFDIFQQIFSPFHCWFVVLVHGHIFISDGHLHPFHYNPSNSKDAISKSEIDSAPFGFFCVISESFISGIHSCIHKMGSRSSVTPIHTPSQPYLDVSMNVMYAGSHGISYVQLVGSVSASCSSCCILSINCLTAV